MNIELAKREQVRDIAIKFAQKVKATNIVDWHTSYFEFIKENTRVPYNARRVKICSISRTSYLQLIDNNEIVIHSGGSQLDQEELTLKYGGYEYHSPANSLVVYYRLLE